MAEAAGVTRITVSRFIRQPGIVAPETAARIQAAIDAVSYVPNQQAGHLASGASRLVAALVPNVGASIFAETLHALGEGLLGSGHELLLLPTGYSLAREAAQLRALTGWAPAALVVTGRRHTPAATRLLRAARDAGTPVVEIWDRTARTRGDGLAQIGFDHGAVGRSMARHLLAQGHTALAYVDSGLAEDYRAQERGEGFAAEALNDGARLLRLTAGPGDAFDAGRGVLPALRTGGVSAAAFANDHLACGTLMAAQEARLRVPGDLALLGFGDFPIGRQLRPVLSTVRPPTADIGRAAAAAVLASIESGLPAVGCALPCELIVRGSTVPPSARPQRAGR